MSLTVELLLGLAAVALMLATIRRRARPRNLGSVSPAWLIENEMGRRNDRG